MPLFSYKAINPEGRTIAGLVEADNEQFAMEIMAEKGYSVVSLSLKRSINLGSLGNYFSKVKVKDLAIFSRQFAVMISASVTIVQALKIFAEQSEHPRLKIVIGEIAEEVDGGSRFSDALEKRPDVFSKFYINVVRSGETSGKLDDVLVYLADELEKDYDMTAKIKNAMTYPAFVVSAMVAIGFLMMIFVVPKLMDMITQSGGEMPFATKVLIGTSVFLRGYWWVILIAFSGVIFGINTFKKTPQGSYLIDYIKLRLPIFGPLLQRIYLVRFTRSLETLIVGGITLTNGLRVVAEVVGNEVYSQMIRDTIKEVEDGNSISTIFIESPLIPKMVPQMLSIGERTGKLDLVLNRVTLFYAREIDNVTANLMTLMEPVIMVIMGIAVGFMVAAIIMPMYKMADSF
jgi:type IV pilus assembly protein PilC